MADNAYSNDKIANSGFYTFCHNTLVFSRFCELPHSLPKWKIQSSPLRCHGCQPVNHRIRIDQPDSYPSALAMQDAAGKFDATFHALPIHAALHSDAGALGCSHLGVIPQA